MNYKPAYNVYWPAERGQADYNLKDFKKIDTKFF